MRLSVIVPCYNMGRYVKRCLQSIVDENLKDIEVLLVNDGSTDNTEEEFNKFKFGDNGLDRYPYIRIISQANAGVSAARNAGMALSKGDYVAFVDADDHIEPGGMGLLLELASSNADPDWVLGSFNELNSRGLSGSNILPSLNHAGNDSPIIFYRSVYVGFWGALWGKLYKRDVIVRNNLKLVPGMTISEDTEFNLRFLLNIRSFVTTGSIVYNYWLNDDGAMANFKGDRSIESKKKYCETNSSVTRAIFSNESDYEDKMFQAKRINAFVWLSTIYVLYRSDAKGKYGWLKKICAAAQENDPDWMSHFKAGNPRIIRSLMRLGKRAPHLLLTVVSSVPALRKKMRG